MHKTERSTNGMAQTTKLSVTLITLQISQLLLRRQKHHIDHTYVTPTTTTTSTFQQPQLVQLPYRSYDINTKQITAV